MTGTTQPDPQVEPDEDPHMDALRCIECEFRTDDSPGGWFELSQHEMVTGHRYEHVKPACKPLTAADVPAGQGPASLFLMPEDGHGAVWFKAAGGPQVHIMWDPADSVTVPHLRALWDHLAATLPHVTTEDTP